MKKPEKDCRDREELGPRALAWLRQHMPNFEWSEKTAAQIKEKKHEK